jgi:adhesin transport system membrane fusion protein
MSPLDSLLTRHPLPTWRAVAWPAALILFLALGWANFAKLDEVSVAPGEVIPQGKVKVVQHLEGGIIETIHVREGDTVRAGDPLVQLDLGVTAINRDDLEIRLDGELLRRARLIAEVEGGDLHLPGEAAERRRDVAKAERQAFEARRQELESALAVLQSQRDQRELQVRELEAQLRAVTKNLELARERLRLSGSLLSRGLTARMEHLSLQAEVESLEGQMGSLVPAIPRARIAVEEAIGKITEARDRFRRQSQEELGTAENAIARLREQLDEATKQGQRAEIRSPIDGIVKNMRYNTIGGVVSPGEAIMEIVPTGDKLVVEVKLSPTDRGYVQEGQRAVVKVTAYDFVRYGSLDGTVVLVAPDASSTGKEIPYFRVVVETAKWYLGEAQGELPITPGMQATVDIHTGTKTILQYLIKPVLKLRHEAFRER